jgi:hypothetical protein
MISKIYNVTKLKKNKLSIAKIKNFSRYEGINRKFPKLI